MCFSNIHVTKKLNTKKKKKQNLTACLCGFHCGYITLRALVELWAL